MTHDSPAARAAWLRQQQDEAQALASQQHAAGPGHGPVTGPGPYGDHGVNIAVEAAVRAERARCVALARAGAQQHAQAGEAATAAALEALADRLAAPGGG